MKRERNSQKFLNSISRRGKIRWGSLFEVEMLVALVWILKVTIRPCYVPMNPPKNIQSLPVALILPLLDLYIRFPHGCMLFVYM